MTDILLIGSSYPLPQAGGSINYVYNILTGAMPNNMEISILTADADSESNTAFDNINSFRVHRSRFFYHVLDNDRGCFLKKRIFLILQIIIALYHIFKLRPKVVIFTEYTFVCLSAIIAHSCFGFRLGLLTYAEEIQLYLRRKPHLIFLRKLLRKCDFVVTVCDYTKEMLCRIGCDANKIHVIIPPIPYNEELQKHHDVNKDCVDILTVGRLEERKGQLLVIEAIPEIIKRHPNVKYHIVGGGPMYAQLQKKISELCLQNYVKLWGRVDDDKLIKLYKSADIFILPHRELPNGDTEGCPTVFLEASYYRLPVIGGKAGGVSNAIKNGLTGLIIDPQPTIIAHSISELIECPDIRKLYGENGHLYSMNFTKQKQSNIFYNLINRFL